MPFSSQNPLLNLECGALHSIDTGNVMSLHGMWSVFRQCSETLEDGKRLENLSWRIYSRETFCCAQDPPSTQRGLDFAARRRRESPTPLPALSSSASSASSVDSDIEASRCPTSARPELVRNNSSEKGFRREKHITPIDLEKIVTSIRQKQDLKSPISPLPASLTPPSATESKPAATHTAPAEHRPASPSFSQPTHLHDSASTIATAASDMSDMSPRGDLKNTPATTVSSTSIVRGFSREQISKSFRVPVMQSTIPLPSSLKSDRPHPPPAFQKKKSTKFFLGGSSGEHGASSSVDSEYLPRSSIPDRLRPTKKTTSFSNKVSLITKPYDSDSVFEDSDEEEEEEQSESAIEEDMDEWVDDDEEESSGIPDEREMFQRVDSKPNLVSRPSLLTTLMHEKDRAAAMQNVAARAPPIRRSRTTSPNGPLVSSSQKPPQDPRARPIIQTTSNGLAPPTLSPRTTRRNMLSMELTESLRKNLLWERQVRSSTANAALKRRHTSNDVKNLQHYPGEPAPFIASRTEPKNNSSWNDYFDNGLQEYHQKGW
ncbi:DUF1752-domain-containing protein [Trichodelitschia bisporula]|uniref:DUF1752-domain-containing protein n=1 Tax=Trichodelitschia bisporula TaxID=703511 RepID=A0A6G1HSH0_9PEZI|nr:DUF1752-domain-containing protein [Trichodelitschia bisporula]